LSQARLLIINFAGDVREAYYRLTGGGPENYYAQRYFIDAYASLRKYASEVSVLACVNEERYDEVLPNGVRALGGGLRNLNDPEPLFRRIKEIEPTHLVLSSPDWRVMRWLVTKPYRCLASFASSIPNLKASLPRQVITRVRNAQLAFCLNRETFDWVGSYGVASSNLLVEAGVKRSKIIPWDLLLDADSGPYPPKVLRDSTDGFTVCYVGTIQEGKGVGDLIDAVAQLNQQNFPVHATIVGRDVEGFAQARVERHGLQNKVTFAGMVPNSEVEPLMRQCDVVVVPSRPDYPEGFPLVIHHGLRSRTPIVASDHPMFLVHLKHELGAMLYCAGDSQALAETLQRLLTDRELYAHLSAASDETWRHMRVPVKWLDLVGRWLRQGPGDQAWLARETLARNGRRDAG
jgi:glycosyltransferase involved in cell wall biosynthesis